MAIIRDTSDLLKSFTENFREEKEFFKKNKKEYKIKKERTSISFYTDESYSTLLSKFYYTKNYGIMDWQYPKAPEKSDYVFVKWVVDYKNGKAYPLYNDKKHKKYIFIKINNYTELINTTDENTIITIVLPDFYSKKYNIQSYSIYNSNNELLYNGSESNYEFKDNIDYYIYINLTIKLFSITYKIYDENNIEDVDEQIVKTYNVEDKVNLIDLPNLKGYEFSEWITNDVVINGNTFIMPDNNVTITTTKKPKSYLFTFYDKKTGEMLYWDSVQYNSTINVNDYKDSLTKQNYNYTIVSSDIPTIMPSNNTNVYVEYTKKEYTIHYTVDGKEVQHTDMCEWGKTPDLYNYANLEDNQKVSTWVGLIDNDIMPNHDVYLSAKTYYAYDVTYKVNDVITNVQEYVVGDKISLSSYTPSIGYRFSEWSTDDAEINENSFIMPNKNVTISGTITKINYTLRYVVDGETYSSYTLNYKDSVIIPETPTKIGYTFSGWDKGIPHTMPNSNLTFNSYFTINSYTINLYSDDTLYSSYTANYGSNLYYTDLVNPTKEGYTFNRWGVEELPKTMPLGGGNYYAVYNINSYYIEYIVDSETYSGIPYNYGENVRQLIVPPKDGYNAKWDQYPPSIMPANDLVITAIYTPHVWNLTYIIDKIMVSSKKVEYNSAITVYDTKKEGYTFSGWTPDEPETMPDNNLTLIGTYSINSYSVIFYEDTDKVYRTYTANYGANLYYTDLVNPTKEGYTFNGWDKDLPTTMPSNDLEITAVYAINRYFIKYIVDGEIYKIENYEYNDNVRQLIVPPKDGYNAKWDQNPPSTMPANDLVITAIYTPHVLNLTYIIDEEIVLSKSINYGSEIEKFNPIKEGYTFSGWDKNEPDTMPDYNITLNGSFIYNGNYDVVVEYDDSEDYQVTVEYNN